MSDIFDQNAIQLVERIQLALVAGRRDVAEKLARDALKGCVPASDEQFTESLAQPSRSDRLAHVWRVAEGLFSEQPAKWRSLIGRLIKICGEKRALGVVTDCVEQRTQDPHSYIAASISQGDRNPEWRLTDDELCAECEGFGIVTHGRKRDELERQLKGARRRGNQWPSTADADAGLGKEFISGYD